MEPARQVARQVDFLFDSGDERRVGTKRRLISKGPSHATGGPFPFVDRVSCWLNPPLLDNDLEKVVGASCQVDRRSQPECGVTGDNLGIRRSRCFEKHRAFGRWLP